MLNCNMMIRSLRCISTKVRDLPTYDGLSEVDSFMNRFEIEVLEQQRFNSLKWVICVMPNRWWGTHQGSFEDWCECRRMIRMDFGKPRVQLTDNNDGCDHLRMHLSRWVQAYGK